MKKNNNQELITIIIPTHGRNELLKKTLDSVNSQSYKHKEIIVVDDNGRGSEIQRETKKIIDSLNYEVRYIVHEENLNGSAARNTGLNHANGDYICFLDDDDWFESNKLELQLEYLTKLDKDWVGCYSGYYRKSKNGLVSTYLPTSEGEILFKILNFEIDACTGSTLMMKNCERTKNLRFNEELARHQDYDFFAKLASVGKIATITEPVVNILSHDGSNRLQSFREIEDNRLKYMLSTEILRKQLSENENKIILRSNYYFLLKRAIEHKKINKIILYFTKSGNYFQTLLELYSDISTAMKRRKNT